MKQSRQHYFFQLITENPNNSKFLFSMGFLLELVIPSKSILAELYSTEKMQLSRWGKGWTQNADNTPEFKQKASFIEAEKIHKEILLTLTHTDWQTDSTHTNWQTDWTQQSDQDKGKQKDYIHIDTKRHRWGN